MYLDHVVTYRAGSFGYHGMIPESGHAIVHHDSKKYLYRISKGNLNKFKALLRVGFKCDTENKLSGKYPYYTIG